MNFLPVHLGHPLDSSNGPHEIIEPQVRSDAYRHVAPSYLYDSPVDNGSAAKSLSIVHENGHIPREYGVGGLVSSVDMITQSGRQFTSSPRNSGFIAHNDDIMQIDRKSKSDKFRIGREVQAHEKRLRKELEQQEILRKDMERQDRERQKEELRIIREQQRQEEKFQREIERREKFPQKERLRRRAEAIMIQRWFFLPWHFAQSEVLWYFQHVGAASSKSKAARVVPVETLCEIALSEILPPTSLFPIIDEIKNTEK